MTEWNWRLRSADAISALGEIPWYPSVSLWFPQRWSRCGHVVPVLADRSIALRTFRVKISFSLP
jgi:hypothetical protein